MALSPPISLQLCTPSFPSGSQSSNPPAGSPEQEYTCNSVMSTPPSAQSVPRSVFSAIWSIAPYSPPQLGAAGSSAPGQSHSEELSKRGDERDTSRPQPPRQVSAVSIPIFFVGSRAPGIGLGLRAEPSGALTGRRDQSAWCESRVDGGEPIRPPMGRNTSGSTGGSSTSYSAGGSMRRLSTHSGLTTESATSGVYTEPPTPCDGFFLPGQTRSAPLLENGNTDKMGAAAGFKASSIGNLPNTTGWNAATHQRTGSEASDISAFSVSQYYGSADCSADPDCEEVDSLVLSDLDMGNQVAHTVAAPHRLLPTSQPACPHLQTPPKRPPHENPVVTPTQNGFTSPSSSLTVKQKKLAGKNDSSVPKDAVAGVPAYPAIQPTAPSPHVTFVDRLEAVPRLYSPPQGPSNRLPTSSLKASRSATLAERRGSPPHTPLIVFPAEQNSNHSLTRQTSRVAWAAEPLNQASSGHSSVSLATSTDTMCQVDHPDQASSTSSLRPIPFSSEPQSYLPSQSPQVNFPSLDKRIIHEHESEDLPVGELFRTLQIWFDQEGFREIAPIFTFSCYNREDDLLYFTTERVGYPFHYDSMQQVPILRKVVAPDYEEAYALLEGKTHRNAAGRRDFISRQASLSMKNIGKYVVEDREGRGGKWIWRLVYEVEERKSLMGKPMVGERSFIPLTFSCSPEVLDPSHARKPTILNAIIKNIGSKKNAVELDETGRPIPRPRGKSVMSYTTRGRAESAARLINTPPRNVSRSNPVAYEAGVPLPPTPISTKTSSGNSHGGDELSRAQAHFFKAISPASASPLRPTTAHVDDNSASSRPGLRKAKTSEHLRRPFTADPLGSQQRPPIPLLPTHLPAITPVFGIAPQPSRATPTTLSHRFQLRPKTADDRRPMTAKSQLDVKRMAAASFFTPATLSI